ncbi:site-2 protease family protein [Streptomyces sp. CC224B]|uniref:site-2 protease family protein n=1 Tax=Streptomyces sp. CC224B TaxID=3044571 RepID=UPI0024A87B20|nr:site-2 protease family protein [Streptomyces sp. CC224B]
MDESGASGRPRSESTPEHDAPGAPEPRPEAAGPGHAPGAPAPAPERTAEPGAPGHPRETAATARTKNDDDLPEPTHETPPRPLTPEEPPAQQGEAAPRQPRETAPPRSREAPPAQHGEAAPAQAQARETATPQSGEATPSQSREAAPPWSREAAPAQHGEATPPQAREAASSHTREAAPRQAREAAPPHPPQAPRVHHGAPASGRPGQRSRPDAADGAKEEPRNPGGGLLMGRPFGVPVYVAPSWFLVAALITWVFGDQLDRVLPELGGARYLVSLFFAVAFYASVLVHELAHTVAALRFKLPVRRIQLQFFGGVSEIEKESETPGREFVLAFVGPLLSLVLAGVFYAGLRAVEPDTVPGVLLAGLMISNLIVAVFNLLPGLPLDGGRMLRAVVWKITGRPMTGTVAAAWVGRVLAISVLIGLPLLNQSGALGGDTGELGGMDAVTDALLAAILAAIIWTGAGNSLRMARLREHLPELRARALTRRAVPVETDTPLSEALRRANAAGARALVVVDPDGDPMAVVREAAIVGVPEHRRPWVAVSGLAQDITEGMRVPADLAGEDLLDRLRATPATEYLVVEDSGEIYGVLSAADVERAFVKAMARPT